MPKLIISLLALATVTAFGADPTQIDQLVSRYNEFGTFNGAVLVAENGEVIFEKGYGLANREWNIANETDTRFRLGSITKQFTAALILKLVEDGKVQLNAPLSQYLPEYPADVADRVTVHQLLTHTSGIKSYTGMPKFFAGDFRNPKKPLEFVSYFANEPLDFEPGEDFKYNNSGFFLLGVIIEQVTGQSYAEVLTERIFKPLGMNSSGYDTHDAVIEKRATGYQYGLDGYKNARYLDMSLPYAAGSLYSTVEDLYRWDRALAAGKVLSAEMQTKMFAPHVKAAEVPQNMHYGYGWFIGQFDHPVEEGGKLNRVWHGGGINGFNTTIQRIPKDDHLIVLLNNTPAASLYKIAEEIRAILYGKTIDSPPEPVSRELYRSYRQSGIERALERHSELERANSEAFEMGAGELLRFARFLSQTERPEDEISFLEAAVQDDPKRADLLAALGDSLKRAGRTQEAVKAYGRALQANPKMAVRVVDRLKELTAKE